MNIPLSQLLLGQLEFANVIILNKRIRKQRIYIKSFKNLNPNAKIIESILGQLDLKELQMQSYSILKKPQLLESGLQKSKNQFIKVRLKNMESNHVLSNQEVDVIWDELKYESIGDRRQELVFIGQNLQKQEILDAFENCLLSEQEMMLYLQNGWDDENTNDPFPKDWERLVKEFEDLRKLRGNEGEWEDVWDEDGEMQEQDLEEVQQQKLID